MKYELDEYHRDTPDEELLVDLNRVAQSLGSRRVTINEYDKYGKFHPSTLQRRFGGWFKALSLAGLDRTRNLHISDEEWFENLAKIWEALGRQPRYGEVAQPLSRYSAGGYAHRFGSWRSSLEAFVAFVNAAPSSEKRQSAARTVSLTEHFPAEKTRARETSRSVSWRLRYLVMRRDNFRCSLCGTSPALQPGIVLEVDHKFPWSKGGETVLENLQTLCQVCNNGKSNLLLKEH